MSVSSNRVMPRESKPGRYVACLSLLAALLAGSALLADVVPGRWEKVDSLQSGYPIIVTLKTEDRVEGSFKGSSSEDLTLTELSGGERRFPKSEIGRVVGQQEYEDGVLNGTLIGLAVGFGAGAAVGGVVSETVDVTTGITIPLFGGIAGGIGTLVGYAADKSHKGREVIYDAPN